jgi:hypothetical protein
MEAARPFSKFWPWPIGRSRRTPCGCHARAMLPLAHALGSFFWPRAAAAARIRPLSLSLFSLSCSHRGERHCRHTSLTPQGRHRRATTQSTSPTARPRCSLQALPTSTAIRALVRRESASPPPRTGSLCPAPLGAVSLPLSCISVSP